MNVEDTGDDELLGALREGVVPGIRNKRMAREAPRLYERLLVSGVSRGDAEAKVVELYSVPRVTSALSTLPYMGLVGGPTFDLRKDENGQSWDFRLAEHRDRARRRILREKPFLVVGSPPCTEYSAVQALNHRRLGGGRNADDV